MDVVINLINRRPSIPFNPGEFQVSKKIRTFIIVTASALICVSGIFGVLSIPKKDYTGCLLTWKGQYPINGHEQLIIYREGKADDVCSVRIGKSVLFSDSLGNCYRDRLVFPDFNGNIWIYNDDSASCAVWRIDKSNGFYRDTIPANLNLVPEAFRNHVPKEALLNDRINDRIRVTHVLADDFIQTSGTYLLPNGCMMRIMQEVNEYICKIYFDDHLLIGESFGETRWFIVVDSSSNLWICSHNGQNVFVWRYNKGMYQRLAFPVASLPSPETFLGSMNDHHN